MDDASPEDLTPEERAAVAKSRAEKRLLSVLEPIMEERRCKQWGIPYDAETPSTHRERLALVDTALRDIYNQHIRTRRWVRIAGSAVGNGSVSIAAKFWNGLMGALVLIGLGWIATKFGVKFPGVP